MITITESTEVFQSAECNHQADGKVMLTCTVWADDEAIQEFGGSLYAKDEDTRAKALACANKFSGLTGDSIREYDAFIQALN
jgi:heme-degrading monooxygenase HmoA